VEVTIDRGFTFVTPAHELILSEVLTADRIQFRPHRNRVERLRVGKREYEVRGDDTLVTSEGCAGRVIERLQQAGLVVETKDLRPVSELDACGDIQQGSHIAAQLPEILEAVRSRRIGVIEAPRGRRRSHAVAALSRIFGRSRIFIACATKRVATELSDELSSFLATDVDSVNLRNWHYRSGCRIVCGTYASFDSSSPMDWDVILVEDVEEGIRSHLWEKLTEYALNGKRRYAFSSDRSRWPASTDLDCDVLFGPTIFRARRAERDRDQRVNVVFATAPLQRDCGPGRRGAAKRRTAQRSGAERAEGSRQQWRQLWHSELRNNLIGEIANGFARRQSEPIWRAGLFLEHPNPFNGLRENLRIAVLAETVEHATQIRRVLPDWPICDALPRELDLMQAHQSASERILPDQAIVTVAGAERYHWFDPDVIIVAFGGAAAYLPRGLSRRRNSVLVVDLVDDDGSLESASQRRRRGYVAIGCHVQDRRARQRRGRVRGPESIADSK
jgi:hypothetical protein